MKEDELTDTKKQQHTTKRIYDRLVEEKQFDGGESTVRRYDSLGKLERTLEKANLMIFTTNITSHNHCYVNLNKK